MEQDSITSSVRLCTRRSPQLTASSSHRNVRSYVSSRPSVNKTVSSRFTLIVIVTARRGHRPSSPTQWQNGAVFSFPFHLSSSSACFSFSISNYSTYDHHRILPYLISFQLAFFLLFLPFLYTCYFQSFDFLHFLPQRKSS